MALKVRATGKTRLSPTELFPLLADPRGCMTWHDHPESARPDSTDAPPGPALAGAEYWTRGLCGKIQWRARTTVVAAEPSHRYATDVETIFSHPRAPRTKSSERFVLEQQDGIGSRIRYEIDFARDETGLDWFQRAYFGVVDRLIVAPSLRRNFHHVIRAAESEAARAASSRH